MPPMTATTAPNQKPPQSPHQKPARNGRASAHLVLSANDQGGCQLTTTRMRCLGRWLPYASLATPIGRSEEPVEEPGLSGRV
jgi:hypothetical protein